MKISELIGKVDVKEVRGATDKEIAMLTADSREAGEGAMFVAVRGVTVDVIRSYHLSRATVSPPWSWRSFRRRWSFAGSMMLLGLRFGRR